VENGRLICDSGTPQVGSARSDLTKVVKVNRRKTNLRKSKLYCILHLRKHNCFIYIYIYMYVVFYLYLLLFAINRDPFMIKLKEPNPLEDKLQTVRVAYWLQ